MKKPTAAICGLINKGRTCCDARIQDVQDKRVLAQLHQNLEDVGLRWTCTGQEGHAGFVGTIDSDHVFNEGVFQTTLHAFCMSGIEVTDSPLH